MRKVLIIKLKLIGTMVGIIEFTMMVLITINVYKGCFSSINTYILLIILFQAAFYNRLSGKRPKLLIQKIVILNILLIIVSFTLLPKYTYVESKAIAENKYKNELKHFVEVKSYSNYTIPIRTDGIKEIFMTNRFYYFYFVKNNGEKKYIMINPSKGNIVELDDSYWK